MFFQGIIFQVLTVNFINGTIFIDIVWSQLELFSLMCTLTKVQTSAKYAYPMVMHKIYIGIMR